MKRNRVEDAHFTTYTEISDEGFRELADIYHVILEKQRYINIETDGITARIFARTKNMDPVRFYRRFPSGIRCFRFGRVSCGRGIPLIMTKPSGDNGIKFYNGSGALSGFALANLGSTLQNTFAAERGRDWGLQGHSTISWKLC